MNNIKTFRLEKLYFKFLKPKNIPIEKLQELADLLHEQNFIHYVYQNQTNGLRYSETEKLTGREHRDELFKLIGSLK